MQELLDRLVRINANAGAAHKIDPITVEALAARGPLPWDSHHHDAANTGDGIWGERALVYQKTQDFLAVLAGSVKERRLSPSRKHGKELSQLVECVLYVCGQQDPRCRDGDHGGGGEAADPSELVASALGVLEVDWNLDVGHRHYERAIAALCNAGKWELAAQLFEKQIDPNAGGPPVGVSIENPLGLYAVAMRCRAGEGREAEQSMVAEHVMDAVQRLSMVSPSDQAGYVLAAGTALGFAHGSGELVDYQRSTVLNLGRPLVAACLRACCLEGDYRAGLAILADEGILVAPGSSHPEEEWQWGGARDRMDPLCRDLAMQVLGGGAEGGTDDQFGEGGPPDEHPWHGSRLALELFRQSREEGVTISREALVGVAQACEREQNWRGAFSVLRTVLDEEEAVHAARSRSPDSNNQESHPAPWLVPGSWLKITERDQLAHCSIEISHLPSLGSFLASVMRNCNRSSNFGMALFALELFRIQLLQSNVGASTEPSTGKKAASDTKGNDSLSPEEGIRQVLFELSRANPNGNDAEHEIMIAGMVALCGLRCHKHAMQLYETTTEEWLSGSEGDREENASAAAVYGYASMHQERSGTPTAELVPWGAAQNHLDQLLAAAGLVKTIRRDAGDSGGLVVGQRRQQMEEILARAMNSCTAAHQPELSLYLLEWMEECVFSEPPQQHQAFLYPMGAETDLFDRAGSYQDSVTAEAILARRYTREYDAAIELFEATLEKHTDDDLSRWGKTVSAGLAAMVAGGRGDDALQVFGALDVGVRSNECYNTVGRYLSRVKDWQQLIDLYGEATAEGCSSEELAMLAMLAVTSTRVENRLRALRAIVNDCASIAGVDPKQWTMTNYWSLKKSLGFYHARLLMWWNDEDRAPLDEVNLAIKEFYRQKSKGTKPENDVLRAIVSGAGRHDSLGLDHTDGYEQVPRSEEAWGFLLSDVRRSTRDSPIRYDPTFIDALVEAYKSLGNSKDCVNYVSGLLNAGGTRLRQTTLENAMEAARLEQADGLYNDVRMLLSEGTDHA